MRTEKGGGEKEGKIRFGKTCQVFGTLLSEPIRLQHSCD